MMQGSKLQSARAPSNPWSDCKQRLSAKIPGPFFASFIEPIEAEGEFPEDGQLRLFVSSEKLKKHIESRYVPLIERTLQEMDFAGQVSVLTGSVARLQALGAARHNLTAEATAGNPKGATVVHLPGTQYPLESGTPRPAEPRQAPTRDSTDSSYDLDRNFVPHPSNAAFVARLLSEGPADPITTINGPAGTGKTHLAWAVAQSFRARGQSARYIPFEVFITEFSLACRNRTSIEWRQELRSHDLLILDDFQFLKKTAQKTQEELRHLMDELRRSGGRLILLSDVAFAKLPLGPDLQGRLYAAAQLTLLYPDAQGRTEILQTMFARSRMQAGKTSTPLPHGLCVALAERMSGDIRRLESAARRLALLESHTTESAERALADLLEDEQLRGTPARALEMVAQLYGVSPSAIQGPARDRKFAIARHLTAYLCTDVLGMRLTQTAAVIGRKEHGSVIHARKKILRLMEEDLFFKQQVETLSQQLLG